MQAWTYVAFLFATGGALAFLSDRNRPFGWPLWMFVAVAAVTTGAAAVSTRNEGDYSALGYVARREKIDGFVTSATCRSCHPGEYQSWHRSYHRTMTQVVSPATVLAPFRGETVQLGARSHRFSRDGDRFLVEIVTRQPDGKVLSSELRQIVLSTGSHHLQVYWAASPNRGEPREISVYWNIAEQRWIPKSDTLITPPGRHNSPGTWNILCIRCHSLNGNPGYVPEADGYDTTVVEFGISCEACHGPAEEHVRQHQNPIDRYRRHGSEQPDPTIVNPAKLSARASSQVCGRCHGNFTLDMEQFVTKGMRYRPGQDLEREVGFYDLDKPRPGDEEYVRSMSWPDGTTRTGGDEYNAHMKSPCFKAGKLACVTCHSLHDSDPSDQLAKQMDGDRACLQCHEQIAPRLEAHTHHAASSPGSRCYNCHMPNTTWALSTAMRAHRIDNPVVDPSVLNARPNACNLCHLDKTMAWTAEKLSDWYGTPPPALDEDQKSIAASALWLLKGNAMQRALSAWHMGWEPALRASGKGWQPGLLAQVLDDPYSQVRFVAGKALGEHPGFSGFDYDFIAPGAERARLQQEALRIWRAHPAPGGAGELKPDLVARLRSERDETPIDVPE